MPDQGIDIFTLHIETLKVIEREMERLHVLIQRGDDDNDVTQSQLSDLHNELIRLSNQFSNKECQ